MRNAIVVFRSNLSSPNSRYVGTLYHPNMSLSTAEVVTP